MKKAFTVFSLFLCLCLLLSACAPGTPEQTTAQDTEAPPEQPILSAPDQSVNSLFALPYCYNAAGVFNPILVHNEACDPLFALLYDGLFAVDSKGNVQPRLALDYASDENSFTVTLREDALFHDGTPVKASDVVWSLKMAKENEASAYAGRFSDVTDISAKDGRTVVLILKREHGSLAHCLDVPIVKNGTGITNNAVGSGRYRIVEQEESMYLMANESWYARPMDSLFPTDLIILTYVDGLDDLVYSMVSGNSNLVRLDPFIFRDKKISGNCDTFPVLSREFLYSAFNTSYYAPTGSSAVRKALAHAIDVSALLADPYAGVVYSAGLYPESVTGTPAPAPAKPDPAETARALRAEGYRFIANQWVDAEGEVLSLTVLCGRDSTKQAAAELIAADLAKAGVSCTVKISDNVAAAMENGNFDVAVCETTLSPDYDFTYLLANEGSENFNQFVVPGLDVLLSDFLAAGHTNGADLSAQINAVLADSMPIIPIGYKQDTVCISREFAFGNVQVSESDPFINLFDWISYR